MRYGKDNIAMGKIRSLAISLAAILLSGTSNAQIDSKHLKKYEREFRASTSDMKKRPIGTKKETEYKLSQCIILKFPIHISLGGSIENYGRIEAASYCAPAANNYLRHIFQISGGKPDIAELSLWTFIDEILLLLKKEASSL